MGSVFTGRTGTSTRTRLMVWLLVLVILAAVGYVYWTRSEDVAARLARAEVTEADAARFREDPDRWINLVGNVMRARSEQGDVAVTQRLSRFMLTALESATPDVTENYAQPAAWHHAAAAASPSIANARSAWIGEIGAGTALRVRVLCVGFGPLLSQAGGNALAPTFNQTLVEGVRDDPELRGLARTLCGASLEEGYWALLQGAGDPALASYTLDLVRLTQLDRLDGILAQETLSLRGLYHLAYAVEQVEAELREAAGNEPDSDALAVADAMVAWRSAVLLPQVADGLDQAPVASGELWQPVDESGTSLALALFGRLGETPQPVRAYGIVDRLMAGAPDGTGNGLATLRTEAATRAAEAVAALASGELGPCRQGVNPGYEVAVRLDPQAGLQPGPGLPEVLRACVERALAGVEVPGQASLVRPLDVTAQIPEATDHNGSD